MENLPVEVREIIWQYLPPKTVVKLSLVCKTWSEHLKSESFWRTFHQRYYGGGKEEAQSWFITIQRLIIHETALSDPNILAWAAEENRDMRVKGLLRGLSNEMDIIDRQEWLKAIGDASVFAAKNANFDLLRSLLSSGDFLTENNRGLSTDSYVFEGLVAAAVYGGDIEMVKYLVEERGCSLYSRYFHTVTTQHTTIQHSTTQQPQQPKRKRRAARDYTPYMMAVATARVSILEYLLTLEGGNDPGSPDRSLVMAAKRGNLRLVQTIVEQELPPNINRSGDRSPLWKALLKGHFDIALYLLGKGAIFPREKYLIRAVQHNNVPLAAFVVDNWGMHVQHKLRGCLKEALESAANTGSEDVFRFLLDIGGDGLIKKMAALSAVEGRSIAILSEILDRRPESLDYDSGAGFTPLVTACTRKREEAALFLIGRGARVGPPPGGWVNPRLNPLSVCVREGMERAVVALLDAGANPIELHKKENPMLHVACNEHMSTIAIALIDKMKDPKYAETGCLDWRDAEGNTALHIATKKALVDVIQALLDAGASVNIQNFQLETPLCLAMWSVHLSARMSTLLLTRGADPHTPLPNGGSPLYYAVSAGQAKIVASLLAHGANPHQVYEGGNTLLHRSFNNCGSGIASGFKKERKIFLLLVSHGVDPTQVNEYDESPLDILRENDFDSLIEKERMELEQYVSYLTY